MLKIQKLTGLAVKAPSVWHNMQKKNLRILLYLILNFCILFAVYQLFLRAESVVGTILYLVAAAALTVAYYIINRGFGKPITDPAELPKEWNHKEKSEYIEKVTAAHERAKKLLYWLFPLIVVLGIDFINLFLLDGIKNSLSRLS